MPYAKDNRPSNPQTFETLVGLMKWMAPKATFRVAETYLDYGAGMKWVTILAAGPDGNEYQMLNPAEWDALELISCDPSPLGLAKLAEMAGAIYQRQIRMLDPENAPKLFDWVITFKRQNGSVDKATVTATDGKKALAEFRETYRYANVTIESCALKVGSGLHA